MNPLLIETIVNEKKLEAQEHSRRCRLISDYNRANPGYIARSVLVVGNLLVQMGTALQRASGRHLAMKEELYHDRLQS